MKTERSSNVMVTVFDGKKIGAAAKKELGDKLKPEATLSTQYTYGYVKTKKGTFVLCSEGVGDSTPIEKEASIIELARSDIMCIGPSFEVKVNAKNLHEFPVLSEKVNLANFIRSFGSRLESNFETWNRFLVNAEPV